MESFLAILKGTSTEPDSKASKPPSRASADQASVKKMFIYMTGHGGDGYFKFRDREELTSERLAQAISAMAAAGR